MRKTLVLLVLLAVCGIKEMKAAEDSIFSVGVLGGLPFNDAVDVSKAGTVSGAFKSAYKSQNFVVGPVVQVNLPASFRFEVDALYRPVSFDIATVSSSVGVSASQWQFPFLLQYRFKVPVVKPFVEAGLSFDHLANISTAAKNITSGPGQIVQTSHGSVVLGGGIEVKVPYVRVSGELRYVHQGSADFRDISNLNQAEVLIGVHF